MLSLSVFSMPSMPLNVSGYSTVLLLTHEDLMPLAAPRPCRHSGCSKTSSHSYCDEHRQAETAQRERWRGSPASRGYDSQWKRVRLQALKLANYLCVRCLEQGRVTPARDVHHHLKIATHPQLRFALNNLVPCCRPCHEAMEMQSK
jgi:5-methylcytosine-specific restriction enzyme A